MSIVAHIHYESSRSIFGKLLKPIRVAFSKGVPDLTSETEIGLHLCIRDINSSGSVYLTPSET